MTDLITGQDVTYMTDTLAQIGSFVEKSVTVYDFQAVGTSGTTSEAGDPQTVTYGTRATFARVNRVSMRDIERADGKYQADDQQFSLRGSFSSSDLVGYDSGTYRPIDGPWKIYMGSNLFWQGVLRKVQS
jgi:hypothetical protein